MVCHNRNAEEYKALEKEFNSPLIVDALITDWQKANKSDVIPTVEQVKERQNNLGKVKKGSVKSMFEIVMNNLTNLSIVTKRNGEYYTPSPSALKAYLSFIGAPSSAVHLVKIGNDYRVRLNTENFTPEVVNNIKRTASSNKVNSLSIVAHLRRIFPTVNYHLVPEEQALEIYEKINEASKAEVDFNSVISFYNPEDNSVVLIKERLNSDVAIEEMLHPFIDTLFNNNRRLFDNLLKEANKTFKELKKEIYSSYTDDKGFDENWRELELVTKALTKVFKNEYETQPTLSFKERLRDFKQWFAKIIKNIYKYLTRRRKTIEEKKITRDLNSNLKPSVEISQERLNQVQELFESNPELANQVYDALGFKKSIFDTKGITLSEETSIGWMFIQLNNKRIGRVKFVNNGERGQLGLSIEIYDDYQNKGYGQVVHVLMSDLAKKDYNSNLYSDYQNTSQEIQLLNALAKKGYAEKIGDVGKASEKYPDSYVTQERAFRIKTSDEIGTVTSQQKQQAQQKFQEYVNAVGKQDIEGFKEFVKDNNQNSNIDSFNQQEESFNINIEDINEDATLTDIAKLLNTSDIQFDIKAQPGGRVKYALSEDLSSLLNQIDNEAKTSEQKDVIRKLFNIMSQDKKKHAIISASPVNVDHNDLIITRDADHVYTDQNGIPYTSTTSSILGLNTITGYEVSREVGNEFDFIVESILLGKAFSDIQGKLNYLKGDKQKQAYDDLTVFLNDLKSDGSILVPQVIVYHKQNRIAGTIDILRINLQGKVSVIDLKTSYKSIKDKAYTEDAIIPLGSDSDVRAFTNWDRISKATQHNIQISMYTNMLEDMGYEIDRDYPPTSIHVKVDITGGKNTQQFNNNFEIEGVYQHTSEGKMVADKIVDLSNDLIDNEQDDGPAYTDNLEEDDEESFEEEAEEENTIDPDSLTEEEKKSEEIKTLLEIIKSLKEYKVQLQTKLDVIQTVNSQIFMNRGKKETQDNIYDLIYTIDMALGGTTRDLKTVYTKLLRDFYNELKSFKDYMTDPDNFDKPEYITYALNYNRFISTYHPLTTNLSHLSPTQTTLLLRSLNMMIELKDEGRKGKGIINDAIYNHVKSIAKMSSQDLTEEEIEEVLKETEDISALEYYTGDLDTSKDVLSRMVAKIYKLKRSEVYERSDAKSQIIKAAARKLQLLSPNQDPQEIFKYMIEDNGRYVEKIDKSYYDELEYHKSKLYDAEGNRKTFRELPDLVNASKEDIAYNKQLAKDLKAYYDFFNAEQVSETGEIIEGNYHRYSDEFIRERNKFESPKVIGDSFVLWIKKKDVNEQEYIAFENKYYKKSDEVDRIAPEMINGIYTGRTIKKPAGRYVKPQYRVVKEETHDGRSLVNPRYNAIMGYDKNGNPKELTALEQAQKEFYLLYTKIFEEELALLPEDQKVNMQGRLPVIRANILREVKKMSDIKVKLWAKMVRNIQNFFGTSFSFRVVTADEEGKIISTLPLYYTGSLKSEKALQEIEKEIKKLEDDYDNGLLKKDVYLRKVELLKGRRKAVEESPSAEELNYDLANGLIKFIAMAEYYHVMSGVEDTFKAIKHVVKKRRTTDSSGMVEEIIKKGKSMSSDLLNRSLSSDDESRLYRRLNKYLHMVYYNDDKLERTTLDKIADNLINYSSLAYVAFNPFGNFNNYAVARINNSIEAAGQRFYSAKASARATYEFNKHGFTGLFKRMSSTTFYDVKSKFIETGDYGEKRPLTKYEAIVEELSMMDDIQSLRELGQDSTSGIRAVKSFTNFGYMFQDAVEYNVQTKVGMAMVIDTYIMNPETKDHMSLYDALIFDEKTKKLKVKDGYTTIVKYEGDNLVEVGEYNDQFRYALRNDIREVNKQIHGNYAYEDRTVLESMAWGKLLMQFHKWVAPAIKARFRKEYYDENLGWMEGRYRAFYRFSAFLFKKAIKAQFDFKEYKQQFLEQEGFKEEKESKRKKAENALRNVQRTSFEILMALALFTANEMLELLKNDDDDDEKSDIEKRVQNYLKYQTDRALKEVVLFLPPFGAVELYRMFKSPMPAMRVLGELSEAVLKTASTPFGYMLNSEEDFYADKDYVYQKGLRKGRLKVSKEWQDVIPIIYAIKKYEDFLNTSDFYIK